MARKKDLRHMTLRKKIRRRYGPANYEWRNGRLVNITTGLVAQGAPEIPKPLVKPPEPKHQHFRSPRY